MPSKPRRSNPKPSTSRSYPPASPHLPPHRPSTSTYIPDRFSDMELYSDSDPDEKGDDREWEFDRIVDQEVNPEGVKKYLVQWKKWAHPQTGKSTTKVLASTFVQSPKGLAAAEAWEQKERDRRKALAKESNAVVLPEVLTRNFTMVEDREIKHAVAEKLGMKPTYDPNEDWAALPRMKPKAGGSAVRSAFPGIVQQPIAILPRQTMRKVARELASAAEAIENEPIPIPPRPKPSATSSSKGKGKEREITSSSARPSLSSYLPTASSNPLRTSAAGPSAARPNPISSQAHPEPLRTIQSLSDWKKAQQAAAASSSRQAAGSSSGQRTTASSSGPITFPQAWKETAVASSSRVPLTSSQPIPPRQAPRRPGLPTPPRSTSATTGPPRSKSRSRASIGVDESESDGRAPTRPRWAEDIGRPRGRSGALSKSRARSTSRPRSRSRGRTPFNMDEDNSEGDEDDAWLPPGERAPLVSPFVQSSTSVVTTTTSVITRTTSVTTSTSVAVGSSARQHEVRAQGARRDLQDKWIEALAEVPNSASVMICGPARGDDRKSVPSLPEEFLYLENDYIYLMEVHNQNPRNVKKHDFDTVCTHKICKNPANPANDDCCGLYHANPKGPRGESLAYDDQGRWRFQIDMKVKVEECNKYCVCNKAKCPHSVVQWPRKYPLEVFDTGSARRGWGVRTTLELERGTILGTYTGELITRAMCEGRDPDYIFNIDHDEAVNGDKSAAGKFSVDSKRVGNWSRFLNHCCDANLTTYTVIYDAPQGKHPGRIVFVTNQKVSRGTELTLDYHPHCQGTARRAPEGLPEVACHCGSIHCRGWC